MLSTSTLTLFFLALFALFVASSPIVTPAPRDVFSPPVLYPRNGTIWRVGQRHNVTWGLLVKNHIMVDLGTLTFFSTESPLAQGFNILIARHEVTVPKVEPGDDYQILVFGDSGNVGEKFTILA
ncbi:hypothetical protein R3P38DRAFT_3307383 [Favolaschia claudopus]|uniref:Uncharacterized protein n=1 Tax=Favolaschia claudopus TaxID=2862362 RepID=A0AAW0DBM7_9AGAR